MLADCPIHAALPAMDLQRARRFYTETLGLRPDREGPDGLFFRCGGGPGSSSIPPEGWPAAPIPR
jgi:catechol 2,3-dioxygenase-like lactoylglutathione lyase family enzyme